MGHFELGPPACPSQFIRGFPSPGTPSQSQVYHMAKKFDHRPRDRSALFPTAAVRFRERSRVRPRHAESILTEAIEKASWGRLGAPWEINANGRLIDNPQESINLVFRFQLFRIDMVRAIDGRKHGRANERCVGDSPIVLPTRRRVAGQILSINYPPRSWAFANVPIYQRTGVYRFGHPTPESVILHYIILSIFGGALANTKRRFSERSRRFYIITYPRDCFRLYRIEYWVFRFSVTSAIMCTRFLTQSETDPYRHWVIFVRFWELSRRVANAHWPISILVSE